MVRPTVARIDLTAVRANFHAIARFLQSSGSQPPGIIGVVKANAYGHGAVEVALALEDAGAAMLACADIEEAILLRQAGVRAPILVFGALSVSDLDGVFTHDLTPTISSPAAARALAAGAARHGTRLRCHLKIDTGMNRLGFRHDNLARTLPEVAGSPHLAVDAVFTHFATADDPDHPLFAEQRLRFERVLAELPALGLAPAATHAANSAALLRDERVWYDYVRPGLLLYGIVPPPIAATLPLVPAMSLESRIVAVKGVRPGEGTGYGITWVADGPRTIAIVPAGYADGLDVRLANRGFMLVRGVRAPVVGSVCMDMTMIDVTGMPVAPGDPVTIVGSQASEAIGVREMAAAIGTIPYELLCRVGARIERVYASGASD
ncbi:MAG TPA: alanine racemase [Vicinamibacterales bacterium]|nr:alanine racemase [Vicinamibacterales bacterium]